MRDIFVRSFHWAVCFSEHITGVGGGVQVQVQTNPHCSLQCEVCNLQCELHTVNYPICNIRCLICTAHCRFCSVQSVNFGTYALQQLWWWCAHCAKVMVGALWEHQLMSEPQLSRLQPSHKCHGLIKAQRFPFTSFNSGPRCPAFWSSYNQTFGSFRAGLRLVFTG